MKYNKTPFSRYLREKRLAAEMTQRRLAELIGITHVYLGEVERGVHTMLSKKHWPALCDAIESITMEELEEKALESKWMTGPLRNYSSDYQELSYAFARRIRNADLNKDEIHSLFRILQKEMS